MIDSSGAVKIDAAAEIVSGPAGTMRYKWSSAAGDTDQAGHFKAEVEVTFADATVRTFPTRGYHNIVISGDLA